MQSSTDYRWISSRWEPSSSTDGRPSRWTLPGVCNTHSHAFQRAMIGLAERRGEAIDSFWSWREAMYAIAQRIEPEQLRDVAAMLYVEMLEAGYTSVCEFHYLHHGSRGVAYDDRAAMSRALIEAANETGIQLQLLPTLYQRGGFDDRALNERQRRFANSTEQLLTLIDTLKADSRPGLRIGVAFHSLRAVGLPAMREVIAASTDPDFCIHLHIAEQLQEVDDCLAHHSSRPVAWLLDQVPVDSRWTLVHATHLDSVETQRLARSQARVALCPTTEANLGDGLFPLPEFLAAGGDICIGSDSHISVSLVEELRWLEYGQRLQHKQRNVSAMTAHSSSGESLFQRAHKGGLGACGGGFDSGEVTLAGSAVELIGAAPATAMDRWIFASRRNLIDRVCVAGKTWVSGGQHVMRESIERRFARAMRDLTADL